MNGIVQKFAARGVCRIPSLARRGRGRRGMILVVVLVVAAMLALSGYAFTQLMLSHREAAELSGRQLQARALVQSGVTAARVFLGQDEATQHDAGGKYSNDARFRGVLVVDDADPARRGRFTFIAPSLDSDGQLSGRRFGLENESNRINLNALVFLEKQQEGSGKQLLLTLPSMTDEIADCILDWLDDDDTARQGGAEADYYAALSPPYKPKNGPLDSVEELLLVKGVTPQLLFGCDVNRNGVVDEAEKKVGVDSSVDNSDGKLDRGWAAYLTLHSVEHNVDMTGAPRVYLNGSDMQKLYDDLMAATGNKDWATFIVAYRQNGPTVSTQKGNNRAGGDLDLTKPGKIPITQTLDLIGAKVQVKYQGQSKQSIFESPFDNNIIAMGLYLPLLNDKVTVNADTVIPGRININQAPRQLLEGIPGMTSDIVNEIMSRRPYEPDDTNPNFRYETWLMTEGIVTLEEMKGFLPFICASGDVYRGQVVGYFEDGTAFARAEVILDATRSGAPIVFWRELSHLGRGYPLETLGLEAEEAP